MPRLRRMRLVSIGHEDARFEDVTLRFTDREGNPTNSVIWLRNGGGKTSLLYAMDGLIPLARGRITVNGSAVEGPGKKVMGADPRYVGICW